MTPSDPLHPCIACGGDLGSLLLDLGRQPLANGLLASPDEPELRYPLAVRTCSTCQLAQLDHLVDPDEIFVDYPYLTSVSSTANRHARRFCHDVVAQLDLGPSSSVVEVASNDGYLLRYFRELGIPSLGVEPAANVAEIAIERGIPTWVRFFDDLVANEIVSAHGHADLVIANNVFAHVSRVRSFATGLAVLAGERGVVSIEVPHLMRLLEGVQFDTIYHEHYSYWSLAAMECLLTSVGLTVFDVAELPTHGGSLRVFAGRNRAVRSTVTEVLRREERGQALQRRFQERVQEVISAVQRHLRTQRDRGRLVTAFGAAAKGATLLNAAGVGPDLIRAIADGNPLKQGRWMPGCRIPVTSPEEMLASQPDEILILPWNLVEEISSGLSSTYCWHGDVSWAIPALTVTSVGGVP